MIYRLEYKDICMLN